LAFKRKFAQLVSLGTILVLSGLIYLTILTWKESQRIQGSIAEFPHARVKSLNGQNTILSSTAPGTTRIVIRFDSNCPSCWAQGREIVASKDVLQETNLFFLSVQSLENISGFGLGLGLDQWENVRFFQVSEDQAKLHFGSGPMPAIYIYDKFGVLRKRFLGETKGEALLIASVPK